MNDANMNDELIAKLSGATSPKDVQAIAKELGNELSDEQAEALFAEIQKANPPEGELSEETLMAVSGGAGRPRNPDEWNPDAWIPIN